MSEMLRRMMDRQRWEAEGGAGAGSGQGQNGGDPGKGQGGDPKGGAAGGQGGEDVAGLKSALEKERAANKQAGADRAALRVELEAARKAAGTNTELLKNLEGLQKTVAEYERREAKRSALGAAIEKVDASQFRIDPAKAERLFERYPGENPEAEAQEIVDLLKSSVVSPAGGGASEGGSPAPRPLKGQPAAGTEPVDLKNVNLGTLARENPEAYRAYREQQRAKNPYAVRQ